MSRTTADGLAVSFLVFVVVAVLLAMVALDNETVREAVCR